MPAHAGIHECRRHGPPIESGVTDAGQSHPLVSYGLLSGEVLAGFGFGECRFDDGAFALCFGGVFSAFGVLCQVGQFVLGLGLLLALMGGFFLDQAVLARFEA